jgi:hypothetical protein
MTALADRRPSATVGRSEPLAAPTRPTAARSTASVQTRRAAEDRSAAVERRSASDTGPDPSRRCAMLIPDVPNHAQPWLQIAHLGYSSRIRSNATGGQTQYHNGRWPGTHPTPPWPCRKLGTSEHNAVLASRFELLSVRRARHDEPGDCAGIDPVNAWLERAEQTVRTAQRVSLRQAGVAVGAGAEWHRRFGNADAADVVAVGIDYWGYRTRGTL